MDDVPAALAIMSSDGGAMADEGAQAVRSAVRAHAARRGWEVVPHRLYADWATKTVAADGRHWLILDPLLRGEEIAERGTRTNLTRCADARFLSPVTGFELDKLAGHPTVGVVDDAVSSGRTLCQLSRLCVQAGSRIEGVAVGCSSRVGRATVESRVPGVRWFAFLPGDWQVLHLRDGCPFLPYSGRPLRSVASPTGSVPADLRLPSWLAVGSIWQVLWLDDDVKQAIRSGYRRVLGVLAARLGRPPQIDDVSLFGEGATCLAESDGDYASDTLLEALLPVTLAGGG